MLALYGHPFSSYTWKPLIALYANDIPFEFRIIDGDHPDHCAVVASAGPLGKFPVLADGDMLIFEASIIIEHLATHHGGVDLVPGEPQAATGLRMIDRVFDNYVMGPMQDIVGEYIRHPDAPHQTRIAEAKARLRQSYAWLERWLEYYPREGQVTLIECAAAPALFYADWVEPVSSDQPRLAAWRAELLRIPAVARCVEEARPFRANFPPGAPDRD